MCFTNPGLKTCALSRPRSLVSVLLQLANAQLARGRPNRPHTGNGRFLHRAQKMPPPVFRGPARCALSIVQESRVERLGFLPVRPARTVPESPNPGWGAPSRPLAHFCAILGALPAAHSVPEIRTAAGNSVKTSDIIRAGQDMSERMSELAVVAPSCTLENLGLLPPLPWLVPPPAPGLFPPPALVTSLLPLISACSILCHPICSACILCHLICSPSYPPSQVLSSLYLAACIYAGGLGDRAGVVLFHPLPRAPPCAGPVSVPSCMHAGRLGDQAGMVQVH